MFDIKKSKKAYIESAEHFVVVRDGVVYLRIVGEEGNYKIMTATAGEDYHGANFFNNQIALNEAALKISASLNTKSRLKSDYHNREYVEIGSCEYISDAYRVAEMLFVKLEENTESRSNDELQNVYTDLAIDESGADVYLSDGMWLSSDGTLKDLGR